MNRNTVGKISFFLQGMKARIDENRDFIKELNLIFKSGLKSFKGRGLPEGDALKWNYKGVSSVLSYEEVLDSILKEAPLYDSMVLTLEERGAVMELSASDKDVSIKNRAVETEAPDQNSGRIQEKDIHSGETSTLLNIKYLINHEMAGPLLKELGIMTKDGKIKNDRIRKYNQIDRYVELIEKELDRFEGRRVHIVDCGCGKSYLSFVLNYYLTEVRKIKCTVTGIDISENVIESSRRMAENLGYRNMNFIVGDIRNLILKDHPDIVMSLHACDTATDLAMNFGVRNKSELIIAVPFCHAEMNTKYSHKDFGSILKHGILKRRMADVLTDGLRALILESVGYEVTIDEYISPLETPKNLMIKAAYTGRINTKAEDEIMKLILALDYAPALYRYLNDLED